MGQPVKLSNTLVEDARVCGTLTERSISGQIEFWAGLGRAVDSLLRGADVLTLRRSKAARPLSECLKEVRTSRGRKRLADVLQQRPFPHYEAAPGHPGLLVRIEENGARTTGRFRNRRFIPA